MEIIANAPNGVRRPKWQYPAPPPTPRILQIPRRHRKRSTTSTAKAAATTPTKPMLQKDRKGKLESLFHQERSFSIAGPLRFPAAPEQRRERVQEERGSCGGRSGGGEDDDGCIATVYGGGSAAVHGGRGGGGGGCGSIERGDDDGSFSAAVDGRNVAAIHGGGRGGNSGRVGSGSIGRGDDDDGFRATVDGGRGTAVHGGGGGGGMVIEEEKWRFQAEMLRAECNLMRMEKEIAVKKIERRRIHMENGLNFALQTMLSGKKKICDGNDASLVFEKEIQELIEKLQKKPSRVRNGRNFDKNASSLQRQLEKFGGSANDVRVKEIRELAADNESFVPTSNGNVEILRMKIKGLSKGDLLERIEEEYGLMLSMANNSATSSASSSKQIEYRDPFLQHTVKEKIPNACSGRCKAIVRRIVEQVRAETEQWSQMQEMLGQVRDEMEELQTSRDFWEDRALDSDHQIQALRSAVLEWKQKVLFSESKSNELLEELSKLSKEIQILKKEQVRDKKTRVKASSPTILQDSPNEMEKRVLVCRVKENYGTNDDDKRMQKDILNDRRRKVHTSNSRYQVGSNRSPLGEIGNLSPLLRQNNTSNTILP